MDYKEFDALYELMVKEENFIAKTKGVEYTQSSGDRLDNFKRHSKDFCISPEVVCGLLLSKHIDSIYNYIKTGKEMSEEGIEGRIKDARVYLACLRGLIQERKEGKLEGYAAPMVEPAVPIPFGNTLEKLIKSYGIEAVWEAVQEMSKKGELK